jgi:hypothetical protein
MRFAFLFAMLFSATAFAQLDFKIDSIATADSAKERKYTIFYHLTNLTDKKLSFFQKPETLISNNGGSMSNCPYYKIYEGDKFLNLGNAFDRPEKAETFRQRDSHDPAKNLEILKEIQENFVLTDSMVAQIKRLGHTSERIEISDSLMIEFKKGTYHPNGLEFRKHNLMEDLFTLDPNETKTFTKIVSWDKDRYFFHDPEEFYLDEKGKYFLEITMVLMKEPFKDKLTEEQYQKILTDKNFIKGVFVSNKKEISFN